MDDFLYLVFWRFLSWSRNLFPVCGGYESPEISKGNLSKLDETEFVPCPSYTAQNRKLEIKSVIPHILSNDKSL